MQLFYSVAAIACIATSFATPPPGYVKKPNTDKDAPAYEYMYEIGDGNGEGQGKAETRTGEFASGSYYVNTGEAATDVKYFADDWGYHPLVKYGTNGKHSSTTTRLALGEIPVKVLRNGGEVGSEVKLPSESQKHKSVQIIQPYSVGENDPVSVTPTHPTTAKDIGDISVKEVVQDSRESSSAENFLKESKEPSTILMPSSSHSTTPQEIAYTATSTVASSSTATPLTYAPLEKLRDIYAKNDYENAALIDEQLFLQSAAGNFGQKVHSTSFRESGIKGYRYLTTTARPLSSLAYSLTKQNGDVTYTVHSGLNTNTAYLSATGKNKKTQRVNNWYEYRKKIPSPSTTENPNYSRNGLSSIIIPSTTLEPTTVNKIFNNDLVSEEPRQYAAEPSQEFIEYGSADSRTVNTGQLNINNDSTHDQKKVETAEQGTYSFGNSYTIEKNENVFKGSGLQAFSAISSTASSSSFEKPIVVAEVTPGYDQPGFSTINKFTDDFIVQTTPAPIYSTTVQPIHPTEAALVTLNFQNQNHTTSSVILNPIQAGVTLVNAGEAHLISNGITKSSATIGGVISGHFESTSVRTEHSESSYEISSSEVGKWKESTQHLQEEQQNRELLEQNRIQQEQQLQKLQQLKEEVQLQQVQQLQQELKLQQNQYEVQELQLQQLLQLEELQRNHELREKLRQHLEKQQEEEKYRYPTLNEDAQLQQEVELQQVEESQQSEQLQGIQLENKTPIVEKLDQTQLQNQQSQLVENVEEQFEAQKIQNYQLQQHQQQQLQQQKYELQQQLDKYQQESNSFLENSSSNQEQDIEIQKSIEIYHNQPVQEIHYQVQTAPQVESSQIDQQSQGRQQYIELQTIENTQQAYRAQDQPASQVLFGYNHASKQGYQGGEKDQFSLGAESQAQQVLVTEHQTDLNHVFDTTRANALPQQTSSSGDAVSLDVGTYHELSGGQQNYQFVEQQQENELKAHKIDQQAALQRVIFGTTSGRAYQLNQGDQSQSNSHSHSHSYESNRGQQQVAVGLPYTLEASQELIIPGIPTTTTEIIENPVFKNHVSVSPSEHYRVEVGQHADNSASHSYAVESTGKLIEKHIPILQPYPVEKLVEKTVHVPQPYPVEIVVEKKIPFPVGIEKVIEKKVPYPVDRVVEKHVPILHPYPVHVKVPQPYPVETIVEKPIRVPVPVSTIVEKKIPVPQPYPVEVEKIIEKKVPYPVEVTKYVDKPVPIHVPQPYPVEKIVERIVEKPIHIRVPYAVEVTRNVPYGVQYGVSYQQIMRPHSHSLYVNHGNTRTPLYGLPTISRYQDFRHHQDNAYVESKQQFQGYRFEKHSGLSFVENGNGNDQISAGGQQLQFKLFPHQNLCGKSNSHVQIGPHFSPRRHSVRSNQKEKPRTEKYIGPVPPQRSQLVRRHQHSLQKQHPIQSRSPQSSTLATRSPDLTTTLRRAREPETKPQSNPGNFRQSRVEYGFKPPMIPSIQYDEKTASKVES